MNNLYDLLGGIERLPGCYRTIGLTYCWLQLAPKLVIFLSGSIKAHALVIWQGTLKLIDCAVMLKLVLSQHEIGIFVPRHQQSVSFSECGSEFGGCMDSCFTTLASPRKDENRDSGCRYYESTC